MATQFFRDNWKPLWSRFISCVALCGYLFPLFAVPMLHTHGCDHEVKTCCTEHADPAPLHSPDSDHSCPSCEFATLIIPCFTVSEKLVWQTDIVDKVCVPVSIPSVACAIILPPCRAPPVV
jgi:hypothetical protein